MRLAVPLVALLGAAACGGSPPKPAPVVEPPPPKHVTRVPIEDSESDHEDGVTFVNKRGHMAEGAIEAGLDPHKGELSECFTTKVGRRRWLGGDVQIHWDIQADGTISSVKLTESDLGAWEIEKCLIDVARTATFDKPVGGQTDFMIPLNFAMKGGAQAWDEDKALAAVGGQLAALDECSAPKLHSEAKHPDNKRRPAKQQPAPAPEKPKPLEKPPTNVTITMYVGPHGKAQSVGFSSQTSEIGEEWAACAQKTALAWRLPDPQGQIAKLAVRYKPEPAE
jgi:hypothetical protein